MTLTDLPSGDTSEATPVEDDEDLARECSTGNIAAAGRVKYQAFLATRFPLEISVERKPLMKGPREYPKGKTAVIVKAKKVRAVEDPRLEPKPDPEPDNPAHALIVVGAPRDARPEHKSQLSAEEVAMITKAAEELAKIAAEIRKPAPVDTK